MLLIAVRPCYWWAAPTSTTDYYSLEDILFNTTLFPAYMLKLSQLSAFSVVSKHKIWANLFKHPFIGFLVFPGHSYQPSVAPHLKAIIFFFRSWSLPMIRIRTSNWENSYSQISHFEFHGQTSAFPDSPSFGLYSLPLTVFVSISKRIIAKLLQCPHKLG